MWFAATPDQNVPRRGISSGEWLSTNAAVLEVPSVIDASESKRRLYLPPSAPVT